MKTRTLITLMGMAFALPLGAADPPANSKSTEVLFFEPENFTDIRYRYHDTELDRTGQLDLLRDFIVQRADSYVPDGWKLSVTVTDVDLAGDFEPWHGPRWSDIRIVKSIYPPRINLTFRLVDADGQVVKEGKRELRDLGFLLGSSMNSQDSLRHEKNMLDDWLRAEFRDSKNR